MNRSTPGPDRHKDAAASSHADTIRAVLVRDPEATEGWPALAALNALLAENERLRVKLDECRRWHDD